MRLQLAASCAALFAAWTGAARAGDAPPGGAAVDGAPSPARRPDAAAESSVAARASAHTTFYADTDHVTVVTPVADVEVHDGYSKWRARGQYLVDAISAASVDIVSTASQRWQEVRQAGSLAGGYKFGDVGAEASGAVSIEPDYASVAGGGTLTWDFADKNYTAIFGYALDHDTIGRAGTPFDVFSRSLFRHTLNAGVTLTLNPSTVLSIVSDFVIERGDQSKPYRYIPMFSPAVAPTIDKGAPIDLVNALRLPERPLEHLPERRERYAVTARFGHRFAASTLRVDERLYTDTWHLHASTTDVRYFVDLSRRFTVWPHVRAHAQSAVYFWRRAYVSTFAGATGSVPLYRTGDRELGPLATLTGGAGASLGIGGAADPNGWMLELQADFMGTDFLDDLYVTSRYAALVAGGLVGVFR